MTRPELFRETIATYRRHGWQLQSVFMRPETLAQSDSISADATGGATFEGVGVRVAEFDAAWFVRPSGANRTACELRLIGDAPYALFEVFEEDESEEDRVDVRREMEARLRDYVAGGRAPLDEELAVDE